eukprot:6468133-Amphidinium_carterae.3
MAAVENHSTSTRDGSVAADLSHENHKIMADGGQGGRQRRAHQEAGRVLCFETETMSSQPENAKIITVSNYMY